MGKKIQVPRDLMEAFAKIGVKGQSWIAIQHFFNDWERASETTGSFKVVREISIDEYTPASTDDELFVDTTDGDKTINMPKGPIGKNYRIVNVGDAGNRVLLVPAAGVKMLGTEDSDYLADSEAAIFTYSGTYGWY